MSFFNKIAYKVMDAQFNIDLDSELNLFFIDNSKKICNYVDSESYVLDHLVTAISDYKGTRVIIGGEFIDPFCGGASRTAKQILSSSKIAEYFRKQQDTYFQCGIYLFSENVNVSFSKLEHNVVGFGNASFRLCAAIRDYRLEDLAYYFVSAANLGKFKPPKNDADIYINDDAKGPRKVTSKADEQLAYDSLEEWDTDDIRHHLIEL